MLCSEQSRQMWIDLPGRANPGNLPYATLWPDPQGLPQGVRSEVTFTQFQTYVVVQ